MALRNIVLLCLAVLLVGSSVVARSTAQRTRKERQAGGARDHGKVVPAPDAMQELVTPALLRVLRDPPKLEFEFTEAAKGTTGGDEVAVATHLSVSRWAELQVLAQAWAGPVHAVVLATSAAEERSIAARPVPPNVSLVVARSAQLEVGTIEYASSHLV